MRTRLAVLCFGFLLLTACGSIGSPSPVLPALPTPTLVGANCLEANGYDAQRDASFDGTTGCMFGKPKDIIKGNGQQQLIFQSLPGAVVVGVITDPSVFVPPDAKNHTFRWLGRFAQDKKSGQMTLFITDYKGE